ncbi:lipocalin family protein [Herminiimonas fonticola]|uniref:lipocalin family protein n=1 Tax=Herminiimonas fonticola TaxID=303380 RepID=UPI00333E6914
MKKLTGLITLALAGFSSLVYAQEVKPVAQVDLTRYVGKWYEIARFPNGFQKDCVANVSAQYNKREDGEIDVINRCKERDGKQEEVIGRARVADKVSNAKLKVRFAPDWLSWLSFVWADYWIIDLAPDYSIAAVGESSREYLWILARTPTIPASEYEVIVNRITEQGFDTSKLVKTRQD